MTTRRSGHRLFKRIGGTRRWVALSSLLGILTIGAGIGLAAMATYLLTQSALLGAAASLSLTILGVRFFAVTRVVGRYCERYLGHLGTFRILTRVRVWMFLGLVRSDVLARSNQRRGDVVAGMVDDVESMQDRLLRVSSPPIVAGGTLLIGTSVLLAINSTAAMILVTAFLLQVLALPLLLQSRVSEEAAQLVRLRAERLALTTEYLDGLETLHLWGQTQRFTDPLAEFDRVDAHMSQRLSTSRALIDAAIIAITGLCVLAVLFTLQASDSTGARLWWIAATPLIALASFEAVGPMLMVPEFRKRSDAAASRILSLTPSNAAQSSTLSAPKNAQAADSLTPSIELVDVSFSFDATTPVLEDASLLIPFGSTIAIAAPSGSGKSTLLNLLLGELSCDSGRVLIGGIDAVVSHEALEPIITAVLQNDHLFDTTLRDNLLVGNGEASDSEILSACATAGFSSVLLQRDRGLDSQIGSNGDLLSGGERQRLMIARAILAESPILILDEAVEHLEPALRSEIVKAILQRRRGRTTVFLAHDVSALSAADFVYDLVHGRFIPQQNRSSF